MTLLDICKNYKIELKQRSNELAQLQSQYDQEEQDLLHFLEGEKCDAVQMVKVAKKLKIIRQERRDVKNEHTKILTLLNTCPQENYVHSLIGKKYVYKTDILSGIAARPKGFVFHVAQTKQNN